MTKSNSSGCICLAYLSSAFSASGRDAVCVEEFFDRRGNFDDVGLYRKMSGVEKLDLCVW